MLRSAVIVVVLLVVTGSLVKQPAAPALAAGQNQPAAGPIPVRNERPRSGQEVLVLRHQQLRKGAHDAGGMRASSTGARRATPVFMPALAERYRLAR